jgi:hypothetical protein
VKLVIGWGALSSMKTQEGYSVLCKVDHCWMWLTTFDAGVQSRAAAVASAPSRLGGHVSAPAQAGTSIMILIKYVIATLSRWAYLE